MGRTYTHTAREGRKQEEHTNVQINTIVFEGERGRETKTEWAQLKLKTTWAERKNAKRQTEDVYVCTRVGQINQTKNGKGKMTRRVVDMLCLYLTCHYSNNWRMNRIEIRLLKKKVPKTRNILMALSLSIGSFDLEIAKLIYADTDGWHCCRRYCYLFSLALFALILFRSKKFSAKGKRASEGEERQVLMQV